MIRVESRGQGTLEVLGLIGIVATFLVAAISLLPNVVRESGSVSEREILEEQIQNTLTDLRIAVEYDPGARAAMTSHGPITYTISQPVVTGTPQPISITIVPSSTKVDITATTLGQSESVEAVIDPEAPAPQSTILAPAPTP